MGKLTDGQASNTTVTLPKNLIPNYQVNATGYSTANYSRLYANVGNRNTNTLQLGIRNIGGTTNESYVLYEVEGYIA